VRAATSSGSRAFSWPPGWSCTRFLQGALPKRLRCFRRLRCGDPIHVAISLGFVLCALGALLALVGGGSLTDDWRSALAWGAITIGMIFFDGVALVNGYVMHALAPLAQQGEGTIVFDAFNRLLVGQGWMGDPLFLGGLTLLAFLEVRTPQFFRVRWVAWAGLISALLSWLRGIGSATGLTFLEPFILANIPAFLWISLYSLAIARRAQASPSS
jgi:hypothetical protein